MRFATPPLPCYPRQRITSTSEGARVQRYRAIIDDRRQSPNKPWKVAVTSALTQYMWSKGASGCLLRYSTAFQLGLVKVINHIGSEDISKQYPALCDGSIGAKLNDTTMSIGITKACKTEKQMTQDTNTK